MHSLTIFFSNLENIVDRLKGAEGERFASSIPYINDTLSLSVSNAINSLTMVNIIEILEHGNERVIEAVLEKGFKLCFKEWSKINLSEVPRRLIASFPIEFVPIEGFSTLDLDLDSVVDCVLARVEENKIKDLHSLIMKLNEEFWKFPIVRSNFNLRMQMTGFHFADFETRQSSTETTIEAETKRYKNLQEVYPSRKSAILDFILNLDILKDLETEWPISEEAYKEILKQFPFYFYVLQTFLHDILMTSSRSPLLHFIVNKSVSIQETIAIRREKFPLEARNLTNLNSIFSKRFSADLDSPSFNNFFSLIRSDLVNSDEIFQLLSPVIDPSNPELILSVFIMTTKEGVVSASDKLIQEISHDLRTNGRILEPFKRNPNLIYSFCHCLRRNRIVTDQVIRSFKLSNAQGQDLYSLSLILGNDFEHLKIILKEYESGKDKRQFKFSTIFSGAFIDNALISSDSKQNKLVNDSTWGLNQVQKSGQSEMFGVKMKQKLELSEAKHVSRRRKKDSLEFDTDASAKALFDKAFARNPQVTSSSYFCLPNISHETISEANSSDEYVYVNQLKTKKRVEPQLDNVSSSVIEAVGFDKLMEKSAEIRFIYSVLSAIGRSMVFPAESLKFSIEGSRVSGDGILKDSLATFGQLISLPKFKTVQFKEQVDGFVPVPLLCPKVMGFLGAWTALCLKNEIPLTWSFAPIFRKFLYRAIQPENEPIFVDSMIEEIYGDLFTKISWIFEDENSSNFEILPRIMKSHRMFNLPPPLPSEACPFLLENYFLEMQEHKNSMASFGAGEGNKNLKKYLAILKFSIKKHLYEGRDQFMRSFSLYFKSGFLQYFKYSLIDEFVGGNRADSAEVSAALYFNGDEIPVINDFDVGGNTIYPLELMKTILSKLTQEQVGKFLWFVSGSSLTPLKGFSDYRIAFNVKESVNSDDQYSFSSVCFNRFTLTIVNRSAKQTFEKFVESISLSAGFAAHEQI
jgi:hypothetical protein